MLQISNLLYKHKIKFNYKTEKGELTESSYKFELRPEYNSVKNCLELDLVLLDAEGATSGNFIINFNPEMYTYTDADAATLNNGYVVSGAPIKTEGILTCAFSVDDEIGIGDCDENGDLLLTTYHLDVSRKKIVDSAFTAGASYFYENNKETFITPVTQNVPTDLFFMLGDADNNRYISAADARIVLRISAKLEKVKDNLMFIRCDVNKDGKITAKDARSILRVSAKLQDSFI